MLAHRRRSQSADNDARPGQGRPGRCRAWTGAAAAVLLAAGLGGCGSGGPQPLSVRCSGPTLAVPDSSEVYAPSAILPPPFTAVTGTPHAVSAAQGATLGSVDPDNPRYGYTSPRGAWSVSLVSNAGGQPAWTTALRAPRGIPGSKAFLNAPVTHYGYEILTGAGVNSEKQYVTAVSSAGKQGPACVLPPLAGSADDTDLLPHAGVLLLQNPLSSSGGSGSFQLDGYSTSDGHRLWSVSTDTSLATGTKFLTAGDTVYVWQRRDAEVAAYDARTGQHLWTASVGSPDPLQSDNGLLGAFGGRVYAAFDGGTATQVAAFDGASGALEWKRAVPPDDLGDGDAVTQVGAGEVLLGGSSSHKELLLSVRTGAVLAEATGSAGAAVDNENLQVCYPAGQLAVAVPDAVPYGTAIHVLSADPSEDRTIAIPRANALDIAITATEAYVLPASKGAPVYGYDLATGKLLWTVPAPGISSDTLLYAFDGGFMLQGSVNLTYR